jgi:REP element-mobilizing transposase RayT
MFGEIINGDMILNDAGKMVDAQWTELKNRFLNIELHEYIVMPNHFHGILQIVVGATLVVAPTTPSPTANAVERYEITPKLDVGHMIENVQPKLPQGQPELQPQLQPEGQRQGIAPTPKTVGDMMDAFKSITTVEYIRGVKNLGWPTFNGKLWQRNYWEHIIRDEKSYHRIAEYIINNPRKWSEDKFNPANPE